MIPFPSIDDSVCREWTGKCEQYFVLEEVLDTKEFQVVAGGYGGKNLCLVKTLHSTERERKFEIEADSMMLVAGLRMRIMNIPYQSLQD